MSKYEKNPTQAEHLASILKGRATASLKSASVQRSHRFPLYDFIRIENMAKMADCTVAAMINQVLSVGIEALYEHLDEDAIQQIHFATQEQVDKSNTQVHQTVGKKAKK